MKKIFVYVLVMMFCVIPIVSFAADFRSGEQPSVGKNEKIANDLYMAGGTITSAGNITGDLVTAGGNILITGDVGQDVIVGGGNISILSNVGDDIRVGGGTIIVNGKVGGDVIAGGGQVTVSGPGVKGDVVVGGGVVRIDAPVAGKLSVGGGSVFINSSIIGDVIIEAESLTLGSSAFISGNLTYKSSKELVQETGAVVKGKIDFTPIAKKDVSSTFPNLFPMLLLWKFLTLLVCALVVGLTLNRYSKQVVVFAAKRPLFELGRGVLIFVTMPIISVLLFVTLVGIPFGILGLLGFAVAMLFTCILVSIVLGSVIVHLYTKKEFEVSWTTIFIGVVAYFILGLLPFIGWLIQMILVFITLGSMIALKIQIVKEWR